MSPAIIVEHLSKTFQSQTPRSEDVRALDDVSLEVRRGEILGILGPNGAGKTTLLNILSTLLLPDTGRISILGIPSHPKNFYRLRQLLNMSSGYPNFPWSLTVTENLRFYGRLYGLSGRVLEDRIRDLIKLFELKDFARRRFDELSSGTKQRLSLAKALINDPQVLFLDEPTVGLDPDIAVKTREVILEVLRTRGLTVLFTTHNMPEAELMCRRIAFIRQGRVIKLATPQEFKQSRGKKDMEEVFLDLARSTIPVEKRDPVASGAGRKEIIPLGDSAVPRASFSPREIFLWLNRVAAFTYRNYLFAIRNFFAFMELLFWPFVSLISIGLLGDFLQLQEKALGFIMTGVITAGVLQVSQLDVAYSLLYEVWSKSVKHTLLTPIGSAENLLGSWVTGIVRGILIFVVLGVAAQALFGFRFPSWTSTGVFLAGIFISALLLGLIVTVLILLFGQKAEITAWMFAYLFMLICGIYYPIETLPSFFYYLAQAIPLTYFLEYYRQSFGFEPELDFLLLKGFALLGVYLLAGIRLMNFALMQARRKGIIVRLSE